MLNVSLEKLFLKKTEHSISCIIAAQSGLLLEVPRTLKTDEKNLRMDFQKYKKHPG